MHESLKESVFLKNSQTALCSKEGSEQGLVLQTWTRREGAWTWVGHSRVPPAGQHALAWNTECRLAPRQSMALSLAEPESSPLSTLQPPAQTPQAE